ncbi:MAG: maleylpyruvate isomerase N-terminal domain-containing protein [Chloroflexota bacterium]
MTDRSFEAGNRRSTEDLATLVAALEGDAWTTDTGEGWTVAVVVGHVAFWDRWQASLWSAAGDGTPIDWPESAADAVNDGIRELVEAVPVEAIADLAVAAAEELDTCLDGLADAQVDAVRAEDRGWLLDAAGHRDEHIAQVRSALESASARS